MSISVQSYNGLEVIEIDYKDHGTLDLSIELQVESAQFASDHPEIRLVIADYSNAKVGPKYVNLAIKNVPVWDSKDRLALYGLSPLQQIILNTYNRAAGKAIKAFPTKKEALAYVLSAVKEPVH